MFGCFFKMQLWNKQIFGTDDSESNERRKPTVSLANKVEKSSKID